MLITGENDSFITQKLSPKLWNQRLWELIVSMWLSHFILTRMLSDATLPVSSKSCVSLLCSPNYREIILHVEYRGWREPAEQITKLQITLIMNEQSTVIQVLFQKKKKRKNKKTSPVIKTQRIPFMLLFRLKAVWCLKACSDKNNNFPQIYVKQASLENVRSKKYKYV